MYKFKDLVILVFTIIAFTSPLISGNEYQPLRLSGEVKNSQDEPVVGATIFIIQNESVVGGTSTDTDGKFVKNLILPDPTDYSVEIRAIGYLKYRTSISSFIDSTNLAVVLTVDPVVSKNIIVTSENSSRDLGLEMSNTNIVNKSKRSLVGTDPIQVIKVPQVVRAGSNHSSKIRVNGTSPKYFINGFDIGYDPNHYGMFSIIPASIVDNLKFYSMGTSSIYQLPTAIDISTKTNFHKHMTGEFNLSVIEATGSFSTGNKHYYILTSVRESMLDKLADKITAESSNRTLPPTDFRDFFISGGIKLSDKSTLSLDQYYVRDFMYYETDPTAANPDGVKTRQDTDDTFLGLRYRYLSGNDILKIQYGLRYGKELYYAKPNNLVQEQGLTVDLSSYHTTHQANLTYEHFTDDSRFVIGNNLEAVSRRKIEMTQINWNFLPPDYISDNPYFLQDLLNIQYAEYNDNHRSVNNSSFISYEKIINSFEYNVGIRADYYNKLVESFHYNLRGSAKYNLNKNYWLKVAYSSYTESPLNRITEPYQIAIHDNLKYLDPIKTSLLSASVNFDKVALSVFRKNITSYPVLIPYQNRIENTFLLIPRSNDSLYFYGGDISVTLDKLVFSNLSADFFYGYTYSEKRTFNTSQPYNLNSPHRFYGMFKYDLGNYISLGTEINVNSGFAYTPSYSSLEYEGASPTNMDYLMYLIEIENSERFPTNVNLNVFLDIRLSRFEIYLNALNVTDHDNPIINTTDGYIYDTGILPSLGIRYLL